MAERASERWHNIRTSVVWDTIAPLISDGTRVLDVGGGTGGFAVGVAERGAAVTVVDPSPNALAALGQRANEAGVADRVNGVQGDVSSLASVVDPGFDLVLCHGVLEIVQQPADALVACREVMAAGSSLSLLVDQLSAAVVASALAGRFQQATQLLAGEQDKTGHRFTVAEVRHLADEAGFSVSDLRGVRVFADLVPGTLLESESGAVPALLELEAAAAQHEDYLRLAAQLHLVLHKK